MSNTEQAAPSHFLRNIVREDLENNKHSVIATRFPPEPNGYLHVGHAKSICLNFGLAQEFGGTCNLRFDDTNPEKESEEYVRSIKEDVNWLGFNWHGDVRFSSDYFDQLYAYAVELIDNGLAYVCELNAEEMREYRGTLKAPGKNSPHRDRSVQENRELFQQMTDGTIDEGAMTLRAKIDMASPNINMRDPIIYRIRKITHHQTGDKWCIYPTYDFTHGQSDAIEGITHSICTLEFEDHKPLYNWFISNLNVPATPTQYEFSRLNINYTVMSKRKLAQIVENGIVDGWNDPRMPTISGLRRRGYTPASIRHFCDMIGVTRNDSLVDVGMLEYAIRDDLDKNAARAMAVLDPLKVTISNFEEGRVEMLTAPGHPNREDMGERQIPLTKTVYIDRADFREEANKKFKRMVTGGEVRLRYGYCVRADEVIKDDEGNIVELICSYDPDTLGVKPEGRKVRGVIHWVSATHGEQAEVRLYDRLFTVEQPDREEGGYEAHINPDSLIVTQAFVEPGLKDAVAEDRFQFEREGYFVADQHDHTADKPVFNKVIGLRDSWAKIEGK